MKGHLFVSQEKRGGKKTYKTAPVRHETKQEQRARLIAFVDDFIDVEVNLRPGRPLFFKEVSRQ